MLDVNELKQAISNRDAAKIASLIQKNDLQLEGNKLVVPKKDIDRYSQYWDKRQLIKKINLNS